MAQSSSLDGGCMDEFGQTMTGQVIVRGRSSAPLLDDGEAMDSKSNARDAGLPGNWAGPWTPWAFVKKREGTERDGTESGNLKSALKIKTADQSSSSMLFWECSMRHFFPGFSLSTEEREGGRLIRKELWARFGQPMHFISLNFQDDDVEFDYQMDSTRRNKRWVRYWLIARSLIGFMMALIAHIRQPWTYEPWMEPGSDTDNETGRRFFVIFPALQGAGYLLQWMQLMVDLEFSLRHFQHQIFFYSLLQLGLVLYYVFWLCVGILTRDSQCDKIWNNVGATSASTLLLNREVVAKAIDQVIWLLLSAQILFRLRFIYFLYLNGLLWGAVAIWLNNITWPENTICMPSTTNIWLLPIISLGFSIISYVFELMQRKDFIQASAVFEESERSEELLANVLPKPIVEELKMYGHEHSIVKHYDSVSVLFADIVSFTTMSARLSPSQLVTLLDQLFLAFDRLAEQNNLEKIKTIGDCYMSAGGIPVKNDTHAADIARMGLGMISTLETGDFVDPITGIPLQVRVGIHSGPAVAGMIGNKKFAYDLWGDAVNTASRMESHGLPMRVHCSADTFTLLQKTFEMEERGVMTVKGKGEMTTYFVVREVHRDPQDITPTAQDAQDDEQNHLHPPGQNWGGGIVNMATSIVRKVSSLGWAAGGEDAASSSRQVATSGSSSRQVAASSTRGSQQERALRTSTSPSPRSEAQTGAGPQEVVELSTAGIASTHQKVEDQKVKGEEANASKADDGSAV